MLVNMMLNESLFYAIGVLGVIGILSKIVVGMTLNRLVKSASNMSKSNHKFMKLVKAKFEHATMANNGVDNVPIFVDKYIHEYKTLGMTIHSWQKIQRISLAVVMILAAVGSALAWNLGFGSTTVLQYATVGVGATIILLGVYQIVDENHRIMGLRIYMVDYLENVLASRYEKAKAAKRVRQQVDYNDEIKQMDSLHEKNTQTRILPNITGNSNVDNFDVNNEFHNGSVDNFDTSIIPSLEINEEIKDKRSDKEGEITADKTILTNTGFGWRAEEEFKGKNAAHSSVVSSAITEASYTGVTTHEATEILENRIQAVKAVQGGTLYGGHKKEKSTPEFHIQTLEEESKESQLTAMEQLLQNEAQKRNIAKEQAGTKSTVNSAMIREILEEFMA